MYLYLERSRQCELTFLFSSKFSLKKIKMQVDENFPRNCILSNSVFKVYVPQLLVLVPRPFPGTESLFATPQSQGTGPLSATPQSQGTGPLSATPPVPRDWTTLCHASVSRDWVTLCHASVPRDWTTLCHAPVPRDHPGQEIKFPPLSS